MCMSNKAKGIRRDRELSTELQTEELGMNSYPQTIAGSRHGLRVYLDLNTWAYITGAPTSPIPGLSVYMGSRTHHH